MLACADVCYRDGRALAACLVFAHWKAAEPLRIVRASLDGAAEYEPGHFYKRELPALLAVLGELPVQPETAIIDGYVWLGNGEEAGLGAHFFKALEHRTAIVGVAKTRFHNDRCSIPVRRGASAHPLYVTAAGIAPNAAANAIKDMHGPNRLPTLLKLADRACRL